MKTSAEIFAGLNSLEQRFPVQAWRSQDIDLWPTYRFRLYGSAMHEVLQNSPADIPSGGIRDLAGRVARSLYRVPFAMLRDWRRNAGVRSGTSAVFFSDGVSFVRLGDSWFDRVMDPVMQALEERGRASLKLTPLSNVHVPRSVPSRFVQPAIDRIKIVSGRRQVSVEIPEFARFHEAAVALFGEVVPSDGWLRVQAARLHGLSNWFGRFFDRCGASHAFVNTYYSLEGLSFVQAARRRGLCSVDLQHGIQGRHHVAYSHWGSVPEAGYSNLPEEFWVWGPEEAAAIEAWHTGCRRHVPRVTGNFWMDRWRDGRDPIVAGYLQQARNLRSSKPQALICLSWGIPEQATRDQIEAAKLCGSSLGWWWRLHPVRAAHSEAFARDLRSEGLDGSNVRQATDLPLYSLVTSADLVVAHSSTVIQEAAQLGVPSVITSEFGAEVHSDLLRSGMALHANDPVGIAAAIQTLAARPRPADTGAVGATRLQTLLDAAFGGQSSVTATRHQGSPA